MNEKKTKSLEERHTIREQFYKIDIVYAYTLVPVDQYQFFNKDWKIRFTKFRNFIYDNIVIDFPGKINIWIEISEPRDEMRHTFSGPRLHVHGTISFSKKAQLPPFLLSFIQKSCKFGRTEIDTIEDIHYWLSYCTKHGHYIKPEKLHLSNMES